LLKNARAVNVFPFPIFFLSIFFDWFSDRKTQEISE